MKDILCGYGRHNTVRCAVVLTIRNRTSEQWDVTLELRERSLAKRYKYDVTINTKNRGFSTFRLQKLLCGPECRTLNEQRNVLKKKSWHLQLCFCKIRPDAFRNHPHDFFKQLLQLIRRHQMTYGRSQWPSGHKARVCGWSLTGIAGLNPAGGMDVCFLWVLCVLSGRCLCEGRSLGLRTSIDCGVSKWMWLGKQQLEGV